MTLTYGLVTPARDEAARLSALAECVSAQTLPPAQWVVVDERRASLGDHYDKKGGLARIRQFRQDKRFRLVSADDGVLVFRSR